MLVLVTNREDLTADWLVLELERRNQPFVRLCTEDYPSRIGIDLAIGRVALETDAGSIRADEIKAIWWRRSVAPVMPEGRDPDEAAWAAGEASIAWHAFWRNVDAHWVNRPDANIRADCKPIQLREAHRQGLSVPPTLITNRLVAARAFQGTHRNLVCKALHRGVIPNGLEERVLYTQRLAAGVLDSVADIGPEPYLFQAFVDKVADVRVTVIGDSVFACRIDSQAEPEATVDWRRAHAKDLHHEPMALNDDLASRLRRLTRTFGLRFAAIDLALDRQGRYIFFEINPNGQWAWIEQLTGQPLSAALADELLRSA